MFSCPLSNALFLANITSIQRRNSSRAITLKASTLRNLFVLKQYRLSWLCSPLVPFAQCWWHHYSWESIIHDSVKHCYCASLLMRKYSSLTQSMQENSNPNSFSSHVKFAIWNVTASVENNVFSNSAFSWAL